MENAQKDEILSCSLCRKKYKRFGIGNSCVVVFKDYVLIKKHFKQVFQPQFYRKSTKFGKKYINRFCMKTWLQQKPHLMIFKSIQAMFMVSNYQQKKAFLHMTFFVCPVKVIKHLPQGYYFISTLWL